MAAIDNLMAKYGSTPAPAKEITRPQPTSLPQGYGCGKCGHRTYTLTAFNMWQCDKCQALYPYIASLKNFNRTIKKIAGLTPCPICNTPWLMQSTKDYYFCPHCQSPPLKEWQTLVCVVG